MNVWSDDALVIARALAEFDGHDLHALSPAEQDRYGWRAVFVVDRQVARRAERRQQSRAEILAHAVSDGRGGFCMENLITQDAQAIAAVNAKAEW